MIPRKRLDIGWTDLWFGLRNCLRTQPAETIQRQIEAEWSPGAASLACLSVRSGFDALLTALALPSGSEILVSAMTIRDMVRIIEAHDLVAVPIDLDVQRLAVRADRLAQAITPRTKAILVAHLFGSRMPLAPALSVAREQGLMVIEDCAQAFAGDAFRGHRASDVTMFSFGPIKTATALGGGILRFRDGELCQRVRQCQSRWPLQCRRQFAARLTRMALVHLLTYRPLYTTFAAFCRATGLSHDNIVSGSVRGFAGGDLLAKTRRRPCAALLALLQRRLTSFDEHSLTKRMALAAMIAARLSKVDRPGALAEDHTHWVFPILSDAPDELVRHLWSRGFDATRGATSLHVVQPPADRSAMTATEAEAAFAKLVYLPLHAAMTQCDIDRLVAAVAEFVGGCVAEVARLRGVAQAARANTGEFGCPARQPLSRKSLT